jgi:hypothetical protein
MTTARTKVKIYQLPSPLLHMSWLFQADLWIKAKDNLIAQNTTTTLLAHLSVIFNLIAASPSFLLLLLPPEEPVSLWAEAGQVAEAVGWPGLRQYCAVQMWGLSTKFSAWVRNGTSAEVYDQLNRWYGPEIFSLSAFFTSQEKIIKTLNYSLRP